MSVPSQPTPTPFHDLDQFIALPRLSGLAMSADGQRLVTTVQTLDGKRTGYRSAVWELDPNGAQPARRITRSAKGEAGAAFTANGDLYFTSARPDPEADAPADEPKAAVWVIPAAGGEGRLVVNRAGGVGALIANRTSDVVLVDAPVLPGSVAADTADAEISDAGAGGTGAGGTGAAGAADGDAPDDQDAALRKLRKDSKVAAILHSGYPVRFWDHDLGPDVPHLFRLAAGATDAADAGTPATPANPDTTDSAADPDTADATDATVSVSPTVDARPPVRLIDLTQDAGAALRNTAQALAPDGSFLLTGWHRSLGAGMTSDLVRIDTAGGARQVLLTGDESTEYGPGPVSPDGTRAVIVVERRGTPERAYQPSLALLDLADGSVTPLAAQWDRWGRPVAWFPDGGSVLVIADDTGRAPLFRIDVASGAVTQLTNLDQPAPDGASGSSTSGSSGADDSGRDTSGSLEDYAASHSDAVISPDGATIYAVRSSYEYPAEVVRIDVASGETTRLPNPAERPLLPGWMEEVTTTAADGTPLRGWLCLPESATDTPAPLAVFIHGGPVGSWNAWTWRWTPWNMVAQGYAVLLPDPALSTGYGQEFVQRGWGRWGAEPFTDLLALTDAAEARPDIDADKTVAMGGSFGGYMSNWVAGHTGDRFRCIITHASLWALDQFGPTTDASYFWEQEITPERALEFSPHRFVEQITAPMLVIHGDKDYRVPIGEGLRLWYELLTRSGRPAAADGSTDHRFLYFPDENHWVLSPQHAKVWYQVVLGFMNQHVHGTPAELPPTLGLTPPSSTARP